MADEEDQDDYNFDDFYDYHYDCCICGTCDCENHGMECDPPRDK